RRAIDLLRARPALVNARGAAGTTPLMEAALYGDARLLKTLLELGGDPNRRNDRGSTALLWAVDDAAKVRLLLDAGADPNAGTDFGQAALLQAAGGPLPVVKLLVARGAEVTQPALNVAARDNPEVLRLLLARLPDKGDAAMTALRTGCTACFAQFPASAQLTRGLLMLLPVAGAGQERALSIALERQADVNARDAKRRTPLMMAAISEVAPPTLVADLIGRGADVHATSGEGLNALDYAMRLGRPPLIEAFVAAGARPTTQPAPARATTAPAADARSAILRSVPMLQKSSQVFYDKGGCVSCHHNLLGIVTTRTLHARGLPFDTALEAREIKTLVDDMATSRDQALQGIVVPGGLYTTTGYILMSLDTAGHAPDASTDALVRLLRRSQMRDGSWVSPVRPPSESSVMTATALALRGLRRYGDARDRGDRVAAARALAWLRATRPTNNNEDRTFRLLGLVWGEARASEIQAAMNDLLATQRTDGGWAQLEYRDSDAYATGQALVALHDAGVAVDSPAYLRGLRYLLDTQLADGSWWVRTRSLFTQHYFESGFPHGRDQFISAAATHWAVQALAWSVPPGS
ncbi:MAG TPA: ankyrin repeat domain-containing protein, partial [Steroidobacteraceae bacterium]